MPVISFFWDPLSDNVLQERDEFGALTAEYTTEPDQYGNVISHNRSGVESQFHFDAVGSTLALTDSGQQVTDTRAYSAFGETTESAGSANFPHEYVGEKGYYQNALTTDYSVRKRSYEPNHGRWLSIDPLGQAGGPSLYLYVANRPLFAADPSGLVLLPVLQDNSSLSYTYPVRHPTSNIFTGSDWDWTRLPTDPPLAAQHVRVETELQCTKTCGCPQNTLRAYYDFYEIWTLPRSRNAREREDHHRHGVQKAWVYLNDKCKPECDPCLPWSFSTIATFEVASLPIPGPPRRWPVDWFVRTPVLAIATVDCYDPPALCTKSQFIVNDFHPMYPRDGSLFRDRDFFDRIWLAGGHKILTSVDTWKSVWDAKTCPKFDLVYKGTGYK